MIEIPTAVDVVFKGRHFDRSAILLCVRQSHAYARIPSQKADPMRRQGPFSDTPPEVRLWHFSEGRCHINEFYLPMLPLARLPDGAFSRT